MLISACQLKTPEGLLDPPNAIAFTPPAGSYNTSQNVTLNSSVAGSTICYTSDGQTPSCAGNSCAAGTVYTAPIALAAPVTAVTTTTVKAVGCKSGTATFPVASATYVLDTVVPTFTGSTPANSATNVAVCAGNPCVATITLRFSESLNTGLTQSLAMSIWDGSSNVSTPSTGTTFTFTKTNVANDTLIAHMSWVHFPELSQIRVSLGSSGIADLAGNNLAPGGISFIFTTAERPVNYAVSDTEQASCYDAAGTVVACTNTGSLGRQDAYFTNTPSAPSLSGPTQHATFTADYTTRDNVTGLVWNSCSEGLSDAGCTTGSAASLTWTDAINGCAALNSMHSGSGYAGRSHWRLATIKDLSTITRKAVTNPSIAITHFPAPLSSVYWTATARPDNIIQAWVLDFSTGSATSMVRTGTGRARCVTDGSSLSAISYTDNGNGTVSDNVSNLVWTKCSMDNSATGTLLPYATNCSGAAGARTWSEALQDCVNLTLAGKSWRLPNANELQSLVKRGSPPSIDTTYFPATQSNAYWSATTDMGTLANAWYTNFIPGIEGTFPKGTSQYVRCVASP